MFEQTVAESALAQKEELDAIEAEIKRLQEEKKQKENRVYEIARTEFKKYANRLNADLRQAGLCLEGEELVLFDSQFLSHYEGVIFLENRYENQLFGDWRHQNKQNLLPKLIKEENYIRERAFSLAKTIADRREKFVELLPDIQAYLQLNPVFSGLKADISETGNPAKIAYENAHIFFADRRRSKTDEEWILYFSENIISRYMRHLRDEKKGNQPAIACPVCASKMEITHLGGHNVEYGKGVAFSCKGHFSYYYKGKLQEFHVGKRRYPGIELPIAPKREELEAVWSQIAEEKTDIAG